MGASGPRKPMNMSNKVMTTPQRETPKDEQMEQAIYKMHALTFKKKCSHSSWNFCFNITLKSVDCFDCRLHTHVNNSLSINWPSQTLFILRARKDV
jgi:hypothetical protein